MEQHTAKGSMLGSGNWSLIPPSSEDFEVYGGADTVARARKWALENQYLLYQGPAQTCVHGLYRMDSCTFRVCTSVGMDHTRIWLQSDGRGAFLLTHPYTDQIPEALDTYAGSSASWSGWAGHRHDFAGPCSTRPVLFT